MDCSGEMGFRSRFFGVWYSKDSICSIVVYTEYVNIKAFHLLIPLYVLRTLACTLVYILVYWIEMVDLD